MSTTPETNPTPVPETKPTPWWKSSFHWVALVMLVATMVSMANSYRYKALAKRQDAVIVGLAKCLDDPNVTSFADCDVRIHTNIEIAINPEALES